MNTPDLSYFASRRTVRKFDPSRHISDADLTRMLGLASHAPTTGNMQLYSVVVSRDAESKQRLAPAHFGQPCVTGCDVLLTFCADYNRFVTWCEASDAKPGYNNFQSFMTAVLDTVIFAQQFNTIAEMEGLGCCYLGTTTYNAPMIGEILELPRLVVPVVTLAVGWPEGEAPVSDRLAPDAFIHHGVYRQATAESVKAMYAEKEALPESARFIAENGKQTLAQVFTDVRYTREACETFSRIYRDYIVAQGFSI